MTKIVAMSDTHAYLDPVLIPYLEACDEIWHAGDIGSKDVLRQLKDLNKILRVVYGNVDGHDIRMETSLNLVWTVEQRKIFMTHIGGYPGHYTERVSQLLKAEQPDIYVCGHSHMLKVIYDPKLQLLHLNPGACGREGFHKIKTVLRFSIDGDQVRDLDIIETGQR